MALGGMGWGKEPLWWRAPHDYAACRRASEEKRGLVVCLYDGIQTRMGRINVILHLCAFFRIVRF